MQKESRDLVQKTTYKKTSSLEKAPLETDCLTAVAYLMNQASKGVFPSPLDWIGNMPRLLFTRGWSVLQIPQNDLQTGDLLFVGNELHKITHVAIILTIDQLFHSVWKIPGEDRGGGCIEKIESFTLRYRVPLSIREVIEYQDHRTPPSRETADQAS